MTADGTKTVVNTSECSSSDVHVTDAFMYQIDLATVVAGALPFKESNVNDTFRGLVLLGDGSQRPAILKDLNPRELANELIVSALAHQAGLPTPDSYLALASPTALAAKKGPLLADGSRLIFASADVGIPNLTQRLTALNANTVALLDDLATWPDLGKLYAFDGWVANVDRHPGNLLHGGKSEFWLIDHGHCLTGPEWKPDSLDPNASVISRLREWLTPVLTAQQKANRVNEAASFQAGLEANVVASARRSCQIERTLPETDIDCAQNFLTARADKISFYANVALDCASLL